MAPDTTIHRGSAITGTAGRGRTAMAPLRRRRGVRGRLCVQHRVRCASTQPARVRGDAICALFERAPCERQRVPPLEWSGRGRPRTVLWWVSSGRSAWNRWRSSCVRRRGASARWHIPRGRSLPGPARVRWGAGHRGGPPVAAPPVYHRPNGNVPVAPPPVYRSAPVAPAPVYRSAPAAPPPVYRSAPVAPPPVYRSAPVAPPPAFHGGAGVPMHRPGGGGVPMHR